MHRILIALSLTTLASLGWLTEPLHADPSQVGVYCPNWDAPSEAFAVDLTARLESRGHLVTRLDGAAMCEPATLAGDRFDLLILADATEFPAEAVAPVAKYVRQGGKLIVLGGPYFSQPTWQYGGELLDGTALKEAIASDVQPKVLFDFESELDRPWAHASNNRQTQSTAVVVSPGADGSSGSLKLTLHDAFGWDTYRTPPLVGVCPPDHALTTFHAKGDANTRQLMVEWREKDNSRWVAVVRLTPQWQRYFLPPSAFQHWPSAQNKGRGKRGDSLQLEDRASLTFGMARSHIDLKGPGETHTVWLDNVGTATVPAELAGREQILASNPSFEPIETVCPLYKLFPVTNLARLRVVGNQTIAGDFTIPAVTAAFSPFARPQGTGLDKDRRWRFVPLIECLDEQDRVCGTAASLMIASKEHGAGMVLSVPIVERAFFQDRVTLDWLGTLADRMLEGLFLLEGGTMHYATFPGESNPVGAVVANRGMTTAEVEVVVSVHDAEGKPVFNERETLTIAPGNERRVEWPWRVGEEPKSPLVVSTHLEQAGRTVDYLGHHVQIWQPKENPRFLTARDGDFYLGKEKWYAHGINYMPSSGTAGEERAYFEYWLDPGSYDPDVIERDLTDMESIGFNMVSAFIFHRSVPSRNLLDFLIRCENHGLKVNLSLRPGTPMAFQWEEMREIVTSHRLAKNDTVIAYDLAWEPLWGPRTKRRKLDDAWRAWIDESYENVATAEAAWQFNAPRENDQVVGPSDQHLSGDGPWRAMAIDYRQFLNELLDTSYSRARELMRSIDPNHLVSFRMTIAGDPTVSQVNLPYDPAGVARAVDLMEPEGYGRIGDWEQVKPGWFTVAYCRAVAPQLPVVWSEFGYNMWSRVEGCVSPERMAFAGQYYDDFYRMAYQSGSNGTIAWYSSPGFRDGERSDFGIQNPDRSWRLVTQVIHDWSARMTEPRDRPQPDVQIPIQLGRDADGVHGIYERTKEPFWNAIESGKTPGLVVRSHVLD